MGFNKTFFPLMMLLALFSASSAISFEALSSLDLFEWDCFVARAHEKVLGIQEVFLNLLSRFSRPTEACFSAQRIQMKAFKIDPPHSAGTCSFYVLRTGTFLFCSFSQGAPYFQPHEDGNQCAVILSTLTHPTWKEVSLTSFADPLNSTTDFGSFGNLDDIPFRYDSKLGTLGSVLLVARCNDQPDVYLGKSELVRHECF